MKRWHSIPPLTMVDNLNLFNHVSVSRGVHEMRLKDIAILLKGELRELRCNPKPYLKDRFHRLKEFGCKKLLDFLRPRNLLSLLFGLCLKLAGAAAIGALLYLALWLSVPETVSNVLYSLQPANQKDIREMHQLVEKYRDYVEQRNRAFGMVANKEQELFFDVVKSVFPVKIESGLISLSDAERDALNNRGTIRKEARFSPFEKVPHFYAIPKNLEFGGQKERGTELKVRCACQTSGCQLSIRLAFDNPARRVPVQSKPQIHWIAAGAFPSTDGNTDDVDSTKLNQSSDDQFSKEACLQPERRQ